MKEREPLTNEDGEVRELTAEDFALARPLVEVMPPEFVEMVLAHQKEMEEEQAKKTPKNTQSVTLSLSPEVVSAFRSTGRGWQTRINEALLQYVKTSLDFS
ncbi:BrnA antitoxin family protein [Lonepinella sp. BR2474]|uniref:BrnA antitoxin family protein n=1 Tax=Lonepinella sp. BR2474 TaxID=3434548 RepID=UPI003F6DAB6C